MAHQDELLRDYRFRVDIVGFDDQLHFSEVSGLGVEIEAIQFRSGGDVDTVGRVVPGRVTYHPVILRRGLARDMTLWRWLLDIEAGEPDFRPVTISILGEDNQPAVAFRLHSAWPSRLELGTLKGLGNEVAVETLQLTYERLDLVDG